jgi:hypothetical protein
MRRTFPVLVLLLAAANLAAADNPPRKEWTVEGVTREALVSHLHQFEIGEVIYGDPQLLYEGWQDETPPVNSLQTKVSKILPKDGKRFRFEYEYDFGDGWEHEVLFEGCLRAEKGTRYPLCLEGEQACPPEDVGGPYGYQEYLEALADPKHERHDEFLEWRGPFDPKAFDPAAATKAMRKGLPNWRETE